MDSARQRFDRLVSALDQLVATEAEIVGARRFEAVADVQQRTGLLVNAIAGMNPRLLDQNARARVASVLSRRQHTMELLESQLATAREELLALEASTQRVSRISPVYGRPNRPQTQARFTGIG